MRIINILLEEMVNVNDIFNGTKSKKTTKKDLDNASKLGCKNPEDLINAR